MKILMLLYSFPPLKLPLLVPLFWCQDGYTAFYICSEPGPFSSDTIAKFMGCFCSQQLKCKELAL